MQLPNQSSAAPSPLSVRYFNVLITGTFLIWALYGLVVIRNSIDAAFLVMDIIFIATTIFAFLQKPFYKPKSYLIGIIFLLYIAVDFLIFYTSQRSISSSFSIGMAKDFLYSDKYLLYIVFFSVIAGTSIFEKNTIKVVFLTCLSLMVLKYTVCHVFQIDKRPTLFVENNYEQMLVLILFVVYYSLQKDENKSIPWWMLGLLVGSVLLSVSRSATMALVPVLVLLFARPKLQNIMLSAFITPIVLGAIYYIFESRIGANGRIDRLMFFGVFSREVSDFGILQYLFGLKPLSPLSYSSCEQLSYYQNLFSAQNNGRCYATILHSYLMRSIHDHGIIGCFAPFIAAYYFIMQARFTKGQALTIVAIAFLCGFSVSGIGANFVAFPIAMACGLKRSPRRLPAGLPGEFRPA